MTSPPDHDREGPTGPAEQEARNRGATIGTTVPAAKPWRGGAPQRPSLDWTRPAQSGRRRIVGGVQRELFDRDGRTSFVESLIAPGRS